MKKVGLVVKPHSEAKLKADDFEQWLSKKGIEIIRHEFPMPNSGLTGDDEPSAPADLFCIFVLGGDGTFLSAARWIGEQDIPILGIRFGEVGFLAATEAEDLYAVAETILNNKFTTEPRMRISIKIIRDNKEIACRKALNDIVINKGALARLAHIETYIDNEYLTTYRCDGLIISTPTGSTAYSLAAGGPVIHPAVPSMIINPICPFTLTNRPVIVPDSASIKIQLAKKPSDIMLTFDGQEGIKIDDGDTIIVEKSPHPVSMIAIPGQNYFNVLKTKLRWSGSRI